MSGSVTAEVFSNTVFAAAYWGTGGVDELGAYGGGSVGTVPATLTGTLTEVGDTVTATIGSVTLTLRAYSDIANGVVFTTPDFATFYVFTRTPFSPTELYPLSYTVAGDSGLACFLAGTRIATNRGEVCVESLRPGDRVVALKSGSLAPVRWLGRRRLAGRHAADPEVWPVRIAAGAFGPEQPRRDLLLSPDHAVFAGGGLIPVRYLVNGATIAPLTLPALDYWHVELPAHDLLLAEGLAVESYLDTGNRGAFEQQAVRPAPAALARRVWAEQACAKLLLDAAAQAPVRRRLLARTAELGWRSTDDPGLTVLADDATLPLLREGSVWRASLPPGTRRVCLRSRSAVPAEIFADSRDTRRLGLAVTQLLLDGAPVPPEDPRRAAGWHAPEPGLHWTEGEAVLLCASADQPSVLQITAPPLLRYWLPRTAELREAA